MFFWQAIGEFQFAIPFFGASYWGIQQRAGPQNCSLLASYREIGQFLAGDCPAAKNVPQTKKPRAPSSAAETMPGQESLDEPVIVLASAIDNSWSTVQLLLKSSRRSDPQFLTVERVH